MLAGVAVATGQPAAIALTLQTMRYIWRCKNAMTCNELISKVQHSNARAAPASLMLARSVC